jgi:hypothetical protein
MTRPTDSRLVLIANDVEDTREMYREFFELSEEPQRVVGRGDPS